MSFTILGRSRRPSNWTAVIRDSRKARRPGPVSLVNADGSYNLSAIMRQAFRYARRYPSLRCWRRQMAVALRHVWSLAKAQRLAAAH